MAVKFSNNGKTTLSAGITSSATSISVTDGSVFPTLGSGDSFYMTLEDGSGNNEIVSVTAVSTNTLTVTRAQEGTTARAFSSGDKAENRLTAAGLNSFVSDAGGDTITGDLTFDGGDVIFNGEYNDRVLMLDYSTGRVGINLGSGNTPSNTLHIKGGQRWEDTSAGNILELQHYSGFSRIYRSNGDLRIKAGGASGSDYLEFSNSGGFTYAGNDIWHAGNDGSGSGLDADLWDGNQFSTYLNQAVLTSSQPLFASGSSASYIRIGDQVTNNNTGSWNKGVHLDANHHGRFRIRTTNHTYGALETYFWADSTVTPSIGIYGDVSTFRFTGSITTLQQANGHTFWHAGNDGSGSGLDADTVDGIQASSFARIDGSGTQFGDSLWINNNNANTYNGYNENIRLYPAGNNVSVIAFMADQDSTSGTPDSSILGYSDRFETRIQDAWQTRVRSGYVDFSGEQRFYSGTSGNHRGSIKATETDDEHFIIATSGGEDIAFKDGGPTGTTNFLIRGDGTLLQGTSNTIWHAGNDGSGSGLDADLLDGSHGSAYKRNNQTGVTAEFAQWYSTSTYAYDSTNGTRYFWILLGTMGASGVKGSIEYETKGDENYPYFVKGTIAFGSFNSSSFSVQHDQHTQDPFGVQVRVDTSRRIWIRFPGSAWSHFFRFRVHTATGSFTTNTSWSTGSTRYDTATVSVPPNSSNDILAGQNLRATTSSVTGSVPSYSYGNYFQKVYARESSFIGSSSTTYAFDSANRPTLKLQGSYPHIHLVDDTNNNSTHGAAISFVSGYNGGNRRWNMGTAANNAGNWSVGYYDSQHNPHYGIGEGWSADAYTRLTVFTDRTQMRGSARSPLFYDLDDTGYYVDPNSASNIKKLRVSDSGTAYFSGMQNGTIELGSISNNYKYTSGWSGSMQGGILANCADNYEFIIHDSGHALASPFCYNGGTTRYFEIGRDLGWGAMYTILHSSARSPVFYDNDNTGYYADFANSNVSVKTNGDLVTEGNYGAGVVSVYSPTRNQGVWSMGSSYRLPKSGQGGGSLYGLAWSYNPNYAGTGNNAQSISGLNHQLLLMQNGSTTAAMGSGIWTSGNITAYSDIRVKTNIERIPDALSKVMQLNGYTFDRTDQAEDPATGETQFLRQTGVIAQEVLPVLPEAVIGDEETHYSVAYGNMVGLLIEAIKELKTEIDALKGAKYD